jgi:membrane-bound serine protease (ClpP class)
MVRPLLLALLLFVSTAQAAILKVRIDGVIDPITSEFIQKAVRQAAESKAEFLLIEMSTPGGLGISMQEIIQAILNSKVPVVCYVTPSGGHAASAGFFILLSADVAAMAPGTNTGAAHPVQLIPIGETSVEMENLRSIVKQRKRNYDLAEKAVLESKSFTAQEALDGGLIDLVARNEQELLKRLDGREVTRFSGEAQKLRTAGERVEVLEPSWREKILSFIADPEIALILGLLGLLGLYIEFTHPGFVLPGVAGAISLILAFLGFSLIPVNIIGVLLILLAFGLFIAEVKVQGFGVLGVGGVISMVLGMLFLVNTPFPGIGIGLGLALAVALPFAAIFIFLLRLVIRAHQRQVTTGEAGLIGMTGQARTDIGPEGGRVFVQGEWWRASSRAPIAKGTRIRILEARNLDLLVEPCAESQADLVSESKEATMTEDPKEDR